MLLGLAAVGGTLYVFSTVGRDIPGANAIAVAFEAQPDGSPLILRDISWAKANPPYLSVDEVPRYVHTAFLADDEHFYVHAGIDAVDFLSGLATISIAKIPPSITEELVRRMFLLGTPKTANDKFKEIILALRLERIATKDQILHVYLASSYFGFGATGLVEASKIYFDKPVTALTIDEAAFLAALPRAVRGFEGFADPETAKRRFDASIPNLVRDPDFLKRRNRIIDHILKQGLIRPEEALAASAVPVPLPYYTVIWLVQEQLRRLGFLTSPPDGRVGPQTKRAVRSFQRDRGIGR